MQTRQKNRKQQIVALAAELLQTRGFENFSYQDLASQLGITKASIHHHFPRKEDLGVALCQWIQEWHENVFARVRAAEGSSWDKLSLYIQRLLNYATGENKICPLSSLQADIAMLPPSMLQAIRRLDQHELDFVAELLAEGRARGEMQFPGEPHNQAVLFVLACKGALQYARVHGGDIFEETMNQFKQLLNC